MSRPTTVLRGMDLVIALVAAVALIYLGTSAFESASAKPGDSSPAVDQGAVEASLSDAHGVIRRRSSQSLAWRNIPAHTPLFGGDGIFVPDGGTATITLRDSGKLVLGPRTLVVIQKSRVELSKGDLVAEASGTEPLLIESGGVVVQVDAQASASVQRTDDRGSVVEAIKGRVTMKRNGKNGEAGVLEPGEVAIRRDDGSPSADQPTSAKLKLLSPLPGYHLKFADTQPETNFRWKPIEGCTAYNLTVKVSKPAGGPASAAPRGLNSSTRDFELQVTKSFVTRPKLPLGNLRWSVTCTDAKGDEHRSLARSLYVTRNPAPVAYHPAQGADVLVNATKSLSVAWTRLVNYDRYRLEVAAAQRFSNPVFSAEVSTPFRDIAQQLPEGPYCFRVKGVAEDRSDMPWSGPRCFQVIRRARIGAPKLLDATFEPLPSGAP